MAERHVAVAVDTGPLFAAVDADQQHHSWVRKTISAIDPPLLTCEAVLSETSFLLERDGLDPSLPFALVRRGVLDVVPVVGSIHDAIAVSQMMHRYRNVPMSFADACLVRIVERMGGPVMTFDSDFFIYRQESKKAVRVLAPT